MFITPIFPTTFLQANLGREIGEKEIKAINDLEYEHRALKLVSKNTNVFDMPKLKNIRLFIQETLDFYMKEVVKASNAEIYITQSWVNVTNKNQRHDQHTHSNSFLSGVFYVHVDPVVDKIIFERQRTAFPLAVQPTEFTLLNSDSWTVNVNNGDLIIFPSDLKHGVPLKTHDSKRISIAFNTFLKGTLGSKHDLTEIKL